MFFKLLFGTVVCGVLHGLVLAPVLLMGVDSIGSQLARLVKPK